MKTAQIHERKIQNQQHLAERQQVPTGSGVRGPPNGKKNYF